MDLGISGLASGFDWRSLVDQLAEVERAPQQRLRNEQSGLQARNVAYGNIAASLNTLKSRIQTLKDPDLYGSRLTKVSDATYATASASAGVPLGNYNVQVIKLATASIQQGTGNVGKALNPAANLNSAGFATAINTGTFTVNGKIIELTSDDTLDSVLAKMSDQTGVRASCDSLNDQIVLTSASQIVLGSATDTSNFLQIARLYNNGTGSVSSAAQLGGVKLADTLTAANLTTPVQGRDGETSTGKFVINGKEITFDLTTDTVAGVLSRINLSDAGVNASYDLASDRFVLSNKGTGDMGIALQDVEGNFLAATGLLGGTFSHGENLRYTVNGSSDLISQSNVITETSSGIAGLSVTVLKEGSFSLDVSSDTEKIKTAINDFITEYNKVQSLIETNTASSTDAKGTVTAGLLAGESDAFDIATRLRRAVFSDASGLSGTLKHLEGLGIDSNSTDNTLKVMDDEKFLEALTTNLNGVQALFADENYGIGTKLDGYVDSLVGEDGSLVAHQDNLTRQSAAIDTQVSALERLVLANKERMIASFVAMETAQAQINEQLQFLSKISGTE